MSCWQIAVPYFWLSQGLETIIQVALSGEIHTRRTGEALGSLSLGSARSLVPSNTKGIHRGLHILIWRCLFWQLCG